MDDDANPFSGFEEEGDNQFLKEMKELTRKKLSLTRLMKSGDLQLKCLKMAEFSRN